MPGYDKKKLLIEILRDLEEAKLAKIQEYIEEKKLSGKEEYEVLTGCNLRDILVEMAEEGLIDRIVPEWGAPNYVYKKGADDCGNSGITS